MRTMYHYGVKGMKWGIRKDRLRRTTKSGDVITLQEKPTGRLASFLQKHSKWMARQADQTADFSIHDPDGQNVGEIELWKKSEDELNIIWVSTNESVRGKGYGTAVVSAAIDIAKDIGSRYVTLEVPGISPDARHIYEKLGFKEMPSPDIDKNDEWGGLTNMRLDLQKKDSRVQHSIDRLDIKQVAQKYMDRLAIRMDEMNKQKGDYEVELYHYGIKGMRWGVRRYQKEDGTLTSAGKQRYSVHDKARDSRLYGKRGMQRIEKRMSKGATKKSARRRELARQVGIGLAVSVAVPVAGLTLSTLADKGYLQKGAKAMKNMYDSRFNVSVLDSSGKVIRRYKDTIKVGENMAKALLRR